MGYQERSLQVEDRASGFAMAEAVIARLERQISKLRQAEVRECASRFLLKRVRQKDAIVTRLPA